MVLPPGQISGDMAFRVFEKSFLKIVGVECRREIQVRGNEVGGGYWSLVGGPVCVRLLGISVATESFIRRTFSSPLEERVLTVHPLEKRGSVNTRRTSSP